MSTVTTATMREQLGAFRGLRQAVVASGDDAVAFLQGQLSQDVEAMAPGDVRWSLLLHPQGKIAAWLRVTRVADAEFVLDVDTGWADEVVARLERFKLRTKCDLEIKPWESLTIVGPGAFDVEVDGAEFAVMDRLVDLPVRVFFGASLSTDIEELPASLAASLRVEAGRPAMGAELDDSTIPAAAGIVEESVSFTKGCYTGQELVARIDSRGNNVPKRLVGLVIDGTVDGDQTVSAGEAVTADGAAVGEVTTVGTSGLLDASVALAYVGRAVEVGASVDIAGQTGVVHELPLVAN